jgi:Na+/melibiose symporter-like transporter
MPTPLSIKNEPFPNLKYFILYGMIYEFAIRLYQPYQVKFLERIGGDEFHISLFNSMPGLIMVFTVLPVILFLRNIDAKKMTGWSLVLMRIFILSYGVVPFMPKASQPWIMIGITALLSIPMAIYSNSFQSLTGDLFKIQNRAQAIGAKNKYSVPVTMTVVFLTGLVLTKVPSNQDELIMIYQIFFVVAFAMTAIELGVLKKLKLVDTVHTESQPVRQVMKEIFSNKGFMVFAGCSLLFHFGWQMGWPLFSIYTIRDLGADEGWLSIISIASMFTMFLGHHYWHRLIDRYGNSKITAICTVGMAITPLLYMASKDLYTLTIMVAFTGIFTSGTINVLLSSVLEVVPLKNRMIYMGVYTTMTNITLAIAPIFGHYILTSRSIQMALLLTAVFRLIGGIAFIIRNIGKARIEH